MEYLGKNHIHYQIDYALKEVNELFLYELIRLYALAVRKYFNYASNRGSYREGVGLLRKLISYGGKKEANLIVEAQKSRTPRRPALIDELSKL